MICWICEVKISDKRSSDSLLNKLCLKNMNITLQINHLHWFGHVSRRKGWIKKCIQHELAGKQECGQSRKTW